MVLAKEANLGNSKLEGSASGDHSETLKKDWPKTAEELDELRTP